MLSQVRPSCLFDRGAVLSNPARHIPYLRTPTNERPFNGAREAHEQDTNERGFSTLTGKMELTKKQVAEQLGVTVRAVEKYLEKGKLTGQQRKGRYGVEVVIDSDEVERFKKEKAEIVYIPRPTPVAEAAMIRAGDQRNAELMERLATVLEDLATATKQRPPKPLDQLAHKLTLSVAEAVALSGLPRHTIKDAITSGKLQARKVGRGERVHRDDLNLFLHEFFNKDK